MLFSRALLLALPHGRETTVELRSLNFVLSLANCSAGRMRSADKVRGSLAACNIDTLEAALVGPGLNEVSINVHRIPHQTYLRAIEPPPPPPPSFLSERLMALRLSSRSRRSWSLRKLTRRVYLARVEG